MTVSEYVRAPLVHADVPLMLQFPDGSASSRWIEPGTSAVKLELHVFPHNEPAIRLYEQFGFEREGVRRDHFRRGGGLVDAVLMAYRVN